MATPTELAQQKFREGLMYLNQESGAIGDIAPLVNNNILQGLRNMNEGLIALSGGLRATYKLLDEVKAKVDTLALNAQRPR